MKEDFVIADDVEFLPSGCDCQSAYPLRKRLFAFFAFAALIVTAAAVKMLFLDQMKEPRSTVHLGTKLPSLLAQDLQGHPVDLRTLVSGEPSVVVFYSPTCNLCETELPYFSSVPPNVRLIEVSEGARASVPVLSPAYAIEVQDPQRALFKIVPLLGLPTVLLVDRDGVVRGAILGEHSRSFLVQQFRKLAGSR